MTATPTIAPPHELVWALSTSLAPARALYVVAELGVADRLGPDPVAVEELAAQCAVEPEPLERVLALLAAFGIFDREDGRYRHTEASQLLRDDHPMSMRSFVRMMGLPVMWSSFGCLESSLRTGTPAINDVAPEGLWGYLEAHADEARVFDGAMTAKARADVAAILDAYDFRPFATIADIGGGRGHFLRAVLEAAPAARGVLFDLPSVIDTLDPPSQRLALHAGDFFADPLPRADAYVLMEVLHDWDDADALAILQAVRRAASPGAVVLVIESTLLDHPHPHVQTLDVVMLAVTGGRERSAEAIGTLFQKAGFQPTRSIDTAGTVRIVEAVAV